MPLFPADFKAQTMMGKVARLFHHVLPCERLLIFLEAAIFHRWEKSGVSFITLSSFLVMACHAAWSCVAPSFIRLRPGLIQNSSQSRPPRQTARTCRYFGSLINCVLLKGLACL